MLTACGLGPHRPVRLRCAGPRAGGLIAVPGGFAREVKMTDAEIRAREENLAKLDDAELLYVFNGMLGSPPAEWKSPALTVGSASEVGACVTRLLWSEIADRFVPPELKIEGYAALLADPDTGEDELEQHREQLRHDFAVRAKDLGPLRPARLAVVTESGGDQVA